MTTKGWRKRAPKNLSERRALRARCGAKAFLDPRHRKVLKKAERSGVRCLRS